MEGAEANLPRGRKACGAQEVAQQTISERSREVALMSGQRQDGARAKTGESKWREWEELDREATGRQGSGGEATGKERAEEGPCTASKAVA